MGFQLLKPPAAEPVSLDEAKLYARISTTADDALVTSLITAARELVETFLNKKIVTQVWRMYLDAFPGYIDQRLGGNIVTAPIAIGATSYMAGIRWAIVPEWAPVRGIVQLAYIGPDPAGSTVVMAAGTDYLIDIVSRPARVTPPFGKFWPISRIQTNSVWIDWAVGYGSTITVSITAGSAVLAGGNFLQADVGAAISVPGAGSGSPATPLTTTIQSVDPNGNATLAASAATTATNVSMYWGEPVPESIKTAIKVLVSEAYNFREPVAKDLGNMPYTVQRLLFPHRDLRM